MIDDATRGSSGLLQPAKAGRGLARIEDSAVGAFDLRRELAGKCGYARKTLQKIQGDALAFEEDTGVANDFSDQVALPQVIAVVVEKFEMFDAAAFIVDGLEQFGARQNESLAGEERAAGAGIFRDAGERRQITRADVFGESAVDGVDDVRVHSAWPAGPRTR